MSELHVQYSSYLGVTFGRVDDDDGEPCDELGRTYQECFRLEDENRKLRLLLRELLDEKRVQG